MVIKKILDITFLLIVTYGCCNATEYPKLQELTVDLGDNLTIPCTDSLEAPVANPEAVMWVREGRAEEISRSRVGANGELTLSFLKREDAGVYQCTVEDEQGADGDVDIVSTRVRVCVRVPPAALVNVTVHPSTVLALLLWDVVDTGGYPVDHFTAHYREKDHPDEEWHAVLPEHISPNVRQIDVYRLEPNTTYLFRIWAVNKLGPGEATVMEATTLHDIEEMELARHLLYGAENFDTRVWVAAVAVVMGTLLMLAFGTCYLLYKECHIPSMRREEHEGIELIPNIILNPGYYDDVARMERIEPDENSNDHTTTRINNNTVVQPMRV